MIENGECDLKAAQAALTLAFYRRDAEKITEAIDRRRGEA